MPVRLTINNRPPTILGVSLRVAILVGDPFQSTGISLENAADLLERQGHKASSQELYRLNGPRVYTL